MPTSIRKALLARYHYDPLDRLADSTPFEQSAIQRYYCKARLSTELQGAVQRTIVQHDDHLLAQQQREGGEMAATLLATDQQRSVLNALDATEPYHLAYTPYGHRPMENGLLSLLGFNGERPDPVTGHYHLGNGYRQFNPVLMRFNSPDSWSPFGEGGLNAYTYCGGDPRNRSDSTGHKFIWLIRNIFKPSKFANQKNIVNKLTTGHELLYNGEHITGAHKPGIDLSNGTKKQIKNIATKILKQNKTIHKENLKTALELRSRESFSEISENISKTGEEIDKSRRLKHLAIESNDDAINLLHRTIQERGMVNANRDAISNATNEGTRIRANAMPSH